LNLTLLSGKQTWLQWCLLPRPHLYCSVSYRRPKWIRYQKSFIRSMTIYHWRLLESFISTHDHTISCYFETAPTVWYFMFFIFSFYYRNLKNNKLSSLHPMLFRDLINLRKLKPFLISIIPNTRLQYCSLSWIGTCATIKWCGVKLVLWAKASTS
jgi:hypothetical protein